MSTLRSPARRTPSFVQYTYTTNESTSSRGLGLGTPTVGNKLILFSGAESDVGVSSISQTNGSWTKIGNTTGGQPRVEIWLGQCVSGTSGSMTVNWSSGSWGAVAVAEFKDLRGLVIQSSENSGTHNIPSMAPKDRQSLYIWGICQDSYGAYYGEYSFGHYMRMFGYGPGAYYGMPAGSTPDGSGSRQNGNGGTIRSVLLEIV